jgi:protein TonB
VITRPVNISYLPPPSLNPGSPQTVNVEERAFRNSVGTPVPVPDPVADSSVTLAPNGALNPSVRPGEGTSGEEEVVKPIVIPDTAPPPWVSVQEMPKIIRRVEPVYPELAILANLEGTVTVKIWVDKEGRPREASVVKSDQEILNDAAVAAAKQFLFTPAYMNSGPVSVWVAIPFKFRLAVRK